MIKVKEETELVELFDLRITFGNDAPVHAWDDMKEKMKKPFTYWLPQVSIRPHPTNIILWWFFRELQDGNGTNPRIRMTMFSNSFFVRKLQSLDYH